MATLKVNVRKQRVGVMQNREMYVAHVDNQTLIDRENLISMAASDSGLSEAQIVASLFALEMQVEELLLEGHRVNFGILGTFRMSVDCKAKERREDMTAECITRRRIIYTPSTRIKGKLNNAKIKGFEMKNVES